MAGENPRPQLDAESRLGRSVALFEMREVTGLGMAKASEMIETGTNEINAGHLRAFVERIERLEEEKKALSGDIKDVFGEAKANGFDVKIIRKI